MFQVSCRNTKKSYEICSKLPIKTVESRSGVLNDNFELIFLDVNDCRGALSCLNITLYFVLFKIVTDFRINYIFLMFDCKFIFRLSFMKNALLSINLPQTDNILN